MKKKLYYLYIVIALIVVAYLLSNNRPESRNLDKLGEVSIQHAFPSVNIKTNERLVSPVEIIVNSEGIWHGFEGELGVVVLVDKNNNILNESILLTSDNDWMQKKKVIYKASLSFDNNKKQSGMLIFKNKVISEVEGDKPKQFKIPVILE